MEFSIIPYFRLNCCRRDDCDVSLMNNKAFQETLGIVGAEACAGIEHLIRASGLSILQKKRFRLRPEQAERFFRKTSEDLDDDDDLKAFIDWMTAGPVDVSIIAGIDAVSRWLDLIGQADCISVYGSPNVQAARVDIRFFYPDAKLVGDLLQMGDARQYLAETVSPLLIKGLVKLCKEKPQIPVLWLAQWLLDNRPHER